MARSFHLTDVGRKRATNEDAFFCDDTLGLYVVCDGVGGRSKGEVASQEACDQVVGFLRQEQEPIFAYLASPDEATAATIRRLLESAVQNACYMIFGLGELDPEQRGMATTLSALLLLGRTAFTAQVGDSRIYLVRGGVARQITEDHTLVNDKLRQGLITPTEAQTMKGKNIITRAVGNRDYVEVDTSIVATQAEDRFVLCSDGLHGYLLDGEIETILAAGPEADAPQRFVQLASDRGGKDNITVVIVAT